MLKIMLSLLIIAPFSFLSAQTNPSFELDTIHFSGKYTGKNLFIKNSFAEEHKGFSVQSVFLNEELVEDDLNATAFEINLSSRDREIGDDLNIAIIYLKGKKPEILNFEDFEK